MTPIMNVQAIQRERLADIIERIQPMHPVKIILFGSSARGEGDRLSDLDLIVVAERGRAQVFGPDCRRL